MFNHGDKIIYNGDGWAGFKSGDVLTFDRYHSSGHEYLHVMELEKLGRPLANCHSAMFTRATLKAVAGRKDDTGKLDMTLFDDMPRALEAVAEVMQWAITKKQPTPYVRGSWLGVSADRYRAAIMRHMSAAAKQASVGAKHNGPISQDARFQQDDETKLLHLAHTACSALFALELTLREQEKA